MDTCIESIDPPADTEIIIYRSVTVDTAAALSYSRYSSSRGSRYSR